MNSRNFKVKISQNVLNMTPREKCLLRWRLEPSRSTPPVSFFSLEVSNLVTLLSRPRKTDYDYYVTWIYVQYYSVYVYSLNTVNYAKVIKKLQNVWSSIIIIIIFIAINRTYCTGRQLLHTCMPVKGFGTLLLDRMDSRGHK